MKSHQSMTIGIGSNPITNARRKRRNIMTMVAILTLGLMLRPLAAPARAHRKSEGWRSDAAANSREGHGASTFPVISPPPDEPPPAPPPSADLLMEYSSDEADDFGRLVNLHDFNTEAGCAERVLYLPQLLTFRDHAVPTAHRKRGASPLDDYDELRPRDYSEDDNAPIEPPDDGLRKDYDPDVQAPSSRDSLSVTAPRGGFIPVDPREIRVRPGDRSPIPITSPLLTPPPGTAAMPNGWRP